MNFNLFRLGRNFFLLLAGQGLSRLGNNFFTLALLWYVLEETGNSTYVGLMAVLLTIPNIFSMFTGVIVDRFNRWNIMIIVDTLQFLITIGISIIGLIYGMPILLLGILTALLQTIGSFFDPAENAVIPTLIQNQEDLPLANSMNQLVTMISKIIGLALGGILLTIMGPFKLMFINGISFLFSLITLFFIRKSKLIEQKISVDEMEDKDASFLLLWKEGFRIVLKSQILIKIIPIAIIVNFSLSPLLSLNPVWVDEVLHKDASAYGFVESSMFVGVIIGSIVVNIIKKYIQFHRLLFISLATLAGSVILLSLIPLFIVTITCIFLFGIAVGIVNVGLFTILQLITPNTHLGRVSGILLGLTNISLPLGMTIGSFLSSYVPIFLIFLSGGVLAAVGAFISLTIPNLATQTLSVS